MHLINPSGLISVRSVNVELPDGQCIICNKIIYNSSSAPAKLKRHLETNHPQLKEKNITHHAGVVILQKHAKTDNENVTEAWFLLSYRIAHAGKLHTIAEDLIKSFCCILGEDVVKTVSAVQYSDNTVSNRIHKISDYKEDKLIKGLKISTDVAGLAVLIVIVKYVFEESIKEDLLLCMPLDANATGEEMFKIINCYILNHNVDWNKCVVCSNVTAAM
ncbi:hypothetical protein PR048_029795, partial [Dryococelus australis]